MVFLLRSTTSTVVVVVGGGLVSVLSSFDIGVCVEVSFAASFFGGANVSDLRSSSGFVKGIRLWKSDHAPLPEFLKARHWRCSVSLVIPSRSLRCGAFFLTLWSKQLCRGSRINDRIMMIAPRADARDSPNVLKEVCCRLCIFCSRLVSASNATSKREW